MNKVFPFQRLMMRFDLIIMTEIISHIGKGIANFLCLWVCPPFEQKMECAKMTISWHAHNDYIFIMCQASRRAMTSLNSFSVRSKFLISRVERSANLMPIHKLNQVCKSSSDSVAVYFQFTLYIKLFPFFHVQVILL